ncbi:MAG TPA: hypothetical protein VMS74_07015 [Acidimicrobiia bacterium]|nr:hypothetical protein [Acidimicrobiia bacterium]
MTQDNKRVVGGSKGLLVIGAGVIVVNWLLLGLIAGEWNPGALYIALALLVLLSAYDIGGVSVSAGAQRAIGLFMGLAAVVIVLGDIRFDGFPNDALRVVAYLVFVIGAVMMFLGARGASD